MPIEDCSICLLEILRGQLTIVTPCRHRFHRQDSCPQCRFSVPVKCRAVREGSIFSLLKPLPFFSNRVDVGDAILSLCGYCFREVYSDSREIVHCFTCIESSCHEECRVGDRQRESIQNEKWICWKCRDRFVFWALISFVLAVVIFIIGTLLLIGAKGHGHPFYTF